MLNIRYLLLVMAVTNFAATPLARGRDGVDQLLINGGAETGDMTGWTDASGNGFTVDADIVNAGAFSFTGGCNGLNGPRENEVYQDVDLTPYISQVDDGQVTAEFSVYGRAASDGPDTDDARAIVEYRDADGAILDRYETVLFRPVNSWVEQDDQRLVPSGSRTIRVRLRVWRGAGYCTDGYFDDAVLRLTWQTVGVGNDTVARLSIVAWPNPCPSAGAQFELAIPDGAEFGLDVYGLDGRHLCSLASGQRGVDARRLAWDGRDMRGDQVPSGIYLVRLTSGRRTATTRVLLLR